MRYSCECGLLSGPPSPGPPAPGKERGGVSFPSTVVQIRRGCVKTVVRNHACPTEKMSTIVVVQISVNWNACQCHSLGSTRTALALVFTGWFRSFLQTWLKKKWQGSSSATTVALTGLALLLTIHLAVVPFLLLTAQSCTSFAWCYWLHDAVIQAKLN